MRVRRVPWSSKAELREMYEMLFSPDSDIKIRQRGLARMNMYLASPSCPLFLPLLHSLMVAANMAEQADFDPSGSETTHKVRLACAMAIVRFVNGMVDPLQTGPYARPISHLAATIGIPPSLISIRHRATHEDLPPLSLLTHSVKVAIEYLHNYAFLPLLSESSQEASSSRLDLNGPVSSQGVARSSEGERLVKRWKRAMKSRMRDKEVGEENETGREIRAIKRALESVDIDEIVDALVAEGGLVPVAVNKRPSFTSKEPTQVSIMIWTPLLLHLNELHPNFTSNLANRLLDLSVDSRLIPNSQSSQENAQIEATQVSSNSYRWSFGTWIMYMWTDPEIRIPDTTQTDMWRKLLQGLLKPDTIAQRLYLTLLDIDKSLEPVPSLPYSTLSLEEEDGDIELTGLEVGTEIGKGEDLSQKLEMMEQRYNQLRQQVAATETTGDDIAVSMDSDPKQFNTATYEDTDLPAGWRRTVSTDLQSKPIGIWA